MHTRTIGDVTVSAIGLNAMPMSLEVRREEDPAIATIHAELGLGISLIDTVDAYRDRTRGRVAQRKPHRPGAAKLRRNTTDVLVATKGGRFRRVRPRERGSRTAARISEGGGRSPAGGAVSTRSGYTSSTGLTPTSPTRLDWRAARPARLRHSFMRSDSASDDDDVNISFLKHDHARRRPMSATSCPADGHENARLVANRLPTGGRRNRPHQHAQRPTKALKVFRTVVPDRGSLSACSSVTRPRQRGW